ncbi:SET domain-containing protein-lysine N-methyltransferase [Endozoicomonas lisbonensis]|uniref:SET domain-containing protein n=1 Tax=Endozoicomonas lisbonensis TaxID=3120522 RepID=A0ABV2SN07_9GAMM
MDKASFPSGSLPVNRTYISSTQDASASFGGNSVVIQNKSKRFCSDGPNSNEPPKKNRKVTIDLDSCTENRAAPADPSTKDHIKKISTLLEVNVSFFCNLFDNNKKTITGAADFRYLAESIIKKLGSVTGKTPQKISNSQKELLTKEMARLVGIEVILENKKYHVPSPDGSKKKVSEKEMFSLIESALDELVKNKERGLPETPSSQHGRQPDKEPHRNSMDEVVLVKVEAETETDIFFRQHRFSNRAPLWHAELTVKQEVEESRPKKRFRMDFESIGVPKCKKIRMAINTAIDQYKKLNIDDRESYLNERMRLSRNDGLLFPKLKGQNEVVAAKDIQQWEVLGHYAGKRLSESTYEKGARAVGALLQKIDTYSYDSGANQLISGFREGNITTCINSCTTYDESDTCLPEKNVSFINHYHKEDKVNIPFLIALKPIKAGDVIWIDYGEAYWVIMNRSIEVESEENS